MHIRPFEPSDEGSRCPTVGALRPDAAVERPAQDIRRKLRVRPDLFLVGVLDGEIVATAMAGYEGHRGWIAATSASRRNTGAGSGPGRHGGSGATAARKRVAPKS